MIGEAHISAAFLQEAPALEKDPRTHPTEPHRCR